MSFQLCVLIDVYCGHEAASRLTRENYQALKSGVGYIFGHMAKIWRSYLLTRQQNASTHHGLRLLLKVFTVLYNYLKLQA